MVTGSIRDPTAVVGVWQVRRTIEDRHERRTTHLTGTLSIEPTDVGLDWHEQLAWHLRDGDVAVSRRLLLARVDERWWVRFEDGRDFHPWSPGEQVVHDCPPDTYRGTVSGTPARWSIVWEVSGPSKDYTTTSVLSPSGRGRPAATPAAAPRRQAGS